jgi:hypothetical protein
MDVLVGELCFCSVQAFVVMSVTAVVMAKVQQLVLDVLGLPCLEPLFGGLFFFTGQVGHFDHIF